MKWKKRYYGSWFVASLVMFSLSYLWHGIFLNDIDKVNYPLALYYGLAAFTYLCIGFIVTILATKVEFSSKKYVNGAIFGGVLGFFFYLIAFVLGISFTNGNEMAHVAIDFMWQMVETGFGGLIAGYMYETYKEQAKIEASNRDI
ncbi:MAG: hypothetical protein JKY53_03120 [Flavobacteriales bacterium]|nr:hypothetical protein [Flavobacteriales bacterium]